MIWSTGTILSKYCANECIGKYYPGDSISWCSPWGRPLSVFFYSVPQHGCHSWLWTSLIHWQGHLKHHKIITSLLMSREWLYTALSQDALKNTSNSLTPFLVCHLFPNRKRCWILKDVLGRRFLVEEDGKKGLTHLLPFARVQRD